MDELIEALNIFRKYTDKKHPTSCEHDTLYVHVPPRSVKPADRKRLRELGFEPNAELDNFYSYRFGSA